MKQTLLTLLLCFATVAATAAPARRVKKIVNGVECVLAGDEYEHFYLAPDGTRYTAEGQLYTPRVEARARRAKANSRRRAKWGATQNPISGKHRGIVILVNFADKEMKTTQEEFNNYFNQEGYNHYGMTGSVHDYFYRASYGQFDLEFDVVGPVTVSHNLSYYGANDGTGQDKYAAAMVAEAVQLADTLGVDFSQYDWDGDGSVDQVFVVYAGNGESQGGPSYTIWPHEYVLSEAAIYDDGPGALKLDGVTVDTYATSSECRGAQDTIPDGIGTACHEFSHCMAIPDFYDTNGENYGMDCWDLMDYGCYNGVTGSGESPWEYTSYERMYCGWLTPTELNRGATIDSMQPLETHPEAYIIYNEGNRNEYYLLENRQAIDFDQYGYGHGMMVLHVDFKADSWINNSPNNYATRQRMTIIPADNSYVSVGNGASYAAGDPYPGTKKRTELTNTSSPKASLYERNSDGGYLMNKPITEIREEGRLISFKFMGGYKLDTPAPHIEATTEDGFTATWDAVPEATSYELMLTDNSTPAPGAVCFEEDVKGFETGDGTVDKGSEMDNYTHTPGWTATKVYTTKSQGAKVGASTNGGSLTTPLIAARAGAIDVTLHLAPYGTDTPALSLFLDQGETPAATFTITSDTTVTASLLVADDFHLTLKPTTKSKQRFYITGFNVESSAPARAKTTTTYTTTETSYTFSELDPTHTYQYALRALNDKGTSEWSEPEEVSLTTDGIQKSKLNIHHSEVYDLQGRRVARPAHGLYIIDGRKVVR